MLTWLARTPFEQWTGRELAALDPRHALLPVAYAANFLLDPIRIPLAIWATPKVDAAWRRLRARKQVDVVDGTAAAAKTATGSQKQKQGTQTQEEKTAANESTRE